MARRGHFYAVGSNRSTPGWPYRSKRAAAWVAGLLNRFGRAKGYRVYRHDR